MLADLGPTLPGQELLLHGLYSFSLGQKAPRMSSHVFSQNSAPRAFESPRTQLFSTVVLS